MQASNENMANSATVHLPDTGKYRAGIVNLLYTQTEFIFVVTCSTNTLV